VPDGKDDGNRKLATQADDRVFVTWLDELTHLVGENGQGNLRSVGLAAKERGREVERLIGRDLGRHRRLERIDDAFDDDRTRRGEGLGEDRPGFSRILDGESLAATGPSEEGEVDGARSQRCSRVPRKTIPYLTQMANSAMSMKEPPSPTKATTWRSGWAIGAAMA